MQQSSSAVAAATGGASSSTSNGSSSGNGYGYGVGNSSSERGGSLASSVAARSAMLSAPSEDYGDVDVDVKPFNEESDILQQQQVVEEEDRMSNVKVAHNPLSSPDEVRLCFFWF
jgi:hypothetical protein